MRAENAHFDGVRIGRDEGGKGLALFATRAFAPGDAIYRLDYWSSDVMPMHATNHSCDPNGAFDDDGMLIAVRTIAPGDEVTFNYLETPTPASPWNFECLCGSANCVGWVRAK